MRVGWTWRQSCRGSCPSLLALESEGRESKVRFLFPTAPTQPVTINNGMSMPSWFDINSLDPTLFKLNPPGLEESAAAVKLLVQKELERGIAPERLILAGFSQGGAVVLEAALSGTPCGAVLVLSSFLGTRLPHKMPQLKVHFFHGEADQVVPLWWGQRSRLSLEDRLSEACHGFKLRRRA